MHTNINNGNKKPKKNPIIHTMKQTKFKTNIYILK